MQIPSFLTGYRPILSTFLHELDVNITERKLMFPKQVCQKISTTEQHTLTISQSSEIPFARAPVKELKDPNLVCVISAIWD